MELLLLAAGTYLGIMVCVWIINAAFSDGGAIGLLTLLAAIFVGLFIGNNTKDSRKK